ncbi:MAG: hypothetical protein KAJ18_08885 [Candidatus Omnitrophica bacterium]|nr:hypothetical protein [Candidatus Omnitrophota bacterium]
MTANKTVFFCVLFMPILFGCAAVSDYYVSQPANKRHAGYEFWPNGIVRIVSPDINLFIQPDNIVNTSNGIIGSFPAPPIIIMEGDQVINIEESRQNEPFYVEILVKAQKEGFVFNPMEVHCKLNNQGYLQASKYINPDKKFRAPKKNGMFTLMMPKPAEYSWRTEKNEKQLDRYYNIPTGKWVGYRIRFDIEAPRPGVPFSIEIKGLKQRDEVVPLPNIQYLKKVKFRDIHT